MVAETFCRTCILIFRFLFLHYTVHETHTPESTEQLIHTGRISISIDKCAVDPKWLTNEPKAKHQFDFQNTRVSEMLVPTFKLLPSYDIFILLYIFYIYSHFTSIDYPNPQNYPNALLSKTFPVSFSRTNTNLALPFQRQTDSCCNKFKFETAWLKATPL